ncbi:TPA: DUF2543 family protein [Enterobacter hormaechei subsp. steigerwaltii]|nr:DUF2543 family protein [Enterobacter hormaechei subsp. steigerwaltii]
MTEATTAPRAPIPKSIYLMVDDYTAQYDAGMPEDQLTEAERESLAGYFFQLVTRLMRGDAIDAATQDRLARESGVEDWRIEGIGDFLNNWGRDDEDDEEAYQHEE